MIKRLGPGAPRLRELIVTFPSYDEAAREYYAALCDKEDNWLVLRGLHPVFTSLRDAFPAYTRDQDGNGHSNGLLQNITVTLGPQTEIRWETPECAEETSTGCAVWRSKPCESLRCAEGWSKDAVKGDPKLQEVSPDLWRGHRWDWEWQGKREEVYKERIEKDGSAGLWAGFLVPSGGVFWFTVDKQPVTKEEEKKMAQGEGSWEPKGLLKWKDGMVVTL